MPDISDKDAKKKLQPKIKSKELSLGYKLLNSPDPNLEPKQNRASPIIEINPRLCKPWKYHNRDQAWLSKEYCQDLIHSIQKNGQLDAALLRKVKDDPQYEYEIIYGVRRWFSCSQLNRFLLAHITEADDKNCMILMHTENADSKDISEFERAFSFAQQMKSGVFKTQREMAEMMGLTQGYISKLIKAGEIFEHPWIKDLFQSKRDISVKYAYDLSVLLKQAPLYSLIKDEADQILSDKRSSGLLPRASIVLKRLINVCKLEQKPLQSVIVRSGETSVVSCSRDKLGGLSLYIKNEAKDLNHLEIEEACLKVIREYVFK